MIDPVKFGEAVAAAINAATAPLLEKIKSLEAQQEAQFIKLEQRAAEMVKSLPLPADGKDGRDGRDGVGFDDLEVEYDGKKTVTFRLTRGDVEKSFDLVLPIILDAGIYKEGAAYQAGDGVTWGGSFWIAQKDTGKKPDTGDWRLAVKRGRDAR